MDAVSIRPIQEIQVHPESRHWFARVERAGAKYVCELGYFGMDGGWVSVATSGVAFVPPDKISAEKTVQFAAIAAVIPKQEQPKQEIRRQESVTEIREQEVTEQSAPLAEERATFVERRALRTPVEVAPMKKALETPRIEREAEPIQMVEPVLRFEPVPEWTPEQERALADATHTDEEHRVWVDSVEIIEMVRHQLAEAVSSIEAAAKGPRRQQDVGVSSAPSSPSEGLGGVSSPVGGVGKPGKGFWFNVNAELVIYGATERDATVTIGGRKIKLRPDGSFSFRFALPDGQYPLPVVAVSADQTDGRAAELKFARATEYHGDVGAHPQDAALKSPEAANL